ncbi:hypothetical protein Bpfe_014628, partial [Biomphalaria pfeifferi]
QQYKGDTMKERHSSIVTSSREPVTRPGLPAGSNAGPTHIICRSVQLNSIHRNIRSMRSYQLPDGPRCLLPAHGTG